MRGQGPAPTLTAVRRSRPGRVALEVDGRPWRVVPDDVVVRCGLRPGLELERPLLRDLRRELRRAEALDVAVRTVSRRDVSTRRLRERLDARGIASGEAQAAVETLSSAGVVDDERLARSRARSLAERGWGDAAVAARLEAGGPAVRGRDTRARRASARKPEGLRRHRSYGGPPSGLAVPRAARLRARDDRGCPRAAGRSSLTAVTIPTLSRRNCLHTERLFGRIGHDENHNYEQRNGTQNPGGRETSSGVLVR